MKNSNADAEMAPESLLTPALNLIENAAEAAIGRLDDLIRDYPNDARLHFLRGSTLAGMEKYGDARLAMQKAVDLAPDFAIARFQLAFLALTSGDEIVARSTWDPLLRLPDDHPLKRFVEGLEAMLAGRFEDAILQLETGMALNTELPPLNRNMAILVQEIRERGRTSDAGEEVESGAHFLLKQTSFKETRH